MNLQGPPARQASEAARRPRAHKAHVSYSRQLADLRRLARAQERAATALAHDDDMEPRVSGRFGPKRSNDSQEGEHFLPGARKRFLAIEWIVELAREPRAAPPARGFVAPVANRQPSAIVKYKPHVKLKLASGCKPQAATPSNSDCDLGAGQERAAFVAFGALAIVVATRSVPTDTSGRRTLATVGAVSGQARFCAQVAGIDHHRPCLGPVVAVKLLAALVWPGKLAIILHRPDGGGGEPCYNCSKLLACNGFHAQTARLLLVDLEARACGPRAPHRTKASAGQLQEMPAGPSGAANLSGTNVAKAGRPHEDTGPRCRQPRARAPKAGRAPSCAAINQIARGHYSKRLRGCVSDHRPGGAATRTDLHCTKWRRASNSKQLGSSSSSSSTTTTTSSTSSTTTTTIGQAWLMFLLLSLARIRGDDGGGQQQRHGASRATRECERAPGVTCTRARERAAFGAMFVLAQASATTPGAQASRLERRRSLASAQQAHHLLHMMNEQFSGANGRATHFELAASGHWRLLANGTRARAHWPANERPKRQQQQQHTVDDEPLEVLTPEETAAQIGGQPANDLRAPKLQVADKVLQAQAPQRYRWPVLALVSFMFIGASGNCLVCLAVWRERRLQTATNYFLLSLAVADLLVCTLVMPFGIIHQFYGYWPYDWHVCNLWVTCDVLTCSSSILHMCFISVGRYLGIRNPLQARQTNLFVSRRAVLWRIAIAWASATLIASPITMMSLYDHKNIVPSAHECSIANKYFMIFGSLIAFFIPMFVMVPSYVMTVRLLSRRAKFVRNDSLLLRAANSTSNEPQKRLHQAQHSRSASTEEADAATQKPDERHHHGDQLRLHSSQSNESARIEPSVPARGQPIERALSASVGASAQQSAAAAPTQSNGTQARLELGDQQKQLVCSCDSQIISAKWNYATDLSAANPQQHSSLATSQKSLLNKDTMDEFIDDNDKQDQQQQAQPLEQVAAGQPGPADKSSAAANEPLPVQVSKGSQPKKAADLAAEGAEMRLNCRSCVLLSCAASLSGVDEKHIASESLLANELGKKKRVSLETNCWPTSNANNQPNEEQVDSPSWRSSAQHTCKLFAITTTDANTGAFGSAKTASCSRMRMRTRMQMRSQTSCGAQNQRAQNRCPDASCNDDRLAPRSSRSLQCNAPRATSASTFGDQPTKSGNARYHHRAPAPPQQQQKQQQRCCCFCCCRCCCGCCARFQVFGESAGTPAASQIAMAAAAPPRCQHKQLGGTASGSDKNDDHEFGREHSASVALGNSPKHTSDNDQNRDNKASVSILIEATDEDNRAAATFGPSSGASELANEQDNASQAHNNSLDESQNNDDQQQQQQPAHAGPQSKGAKRADQLILPEGGGRGDCVGSASAAAQAKQSLRRRRQPLAELEAKICHEICSYCLRQAGRTAERVCSCGGGGGAAPHCAATRQLATCERSSQGHRHHKCSAHRRRAMQRARKHQAKHCHHHHHHHQNHRRHHQNCDNKRGHSAALLVETVPSESGAGGELRAKTNESVQLAVASLASAEQNREQCNSVAASAIHQEDQQKATETDDQKVSMQSSAAPSQKPPSAIAVARQHASRLKRHAGSARSAAFGGFLLATAGNNNQDGEPQMIRYLGSSVQVRSEQKATKVLGLVFFTFVICWTPFFVINFTQGFVRREDLAQYISDDLMTTFQWLGYISSTINPVIYTVFNRNFRRAFRQLLLCREPMGRGIRRSNATVPTGVLSSNRQHSARGSGHFRSFKQSQYMTTNGNTDVNVSNGNRNPIDANAQKDSGSKRNFHIETTATTTTTQTQRMPLINSHYAY